MDFHALERLNADRRAELIAEMRGLAPGRPPGRLSPAVARALRRLADRLDGGVHFEPKRSGTLRVLD